MSFNAYTTYICWNKKIGRHKLIRSKHFDVFMLFKVIVTYKHILKRHVYTSVIF